MSLTLVGIAGRLEAMNQLRRYFISGIATILPLGFTVFIFWFLVSRLGNLFRPVLSRGWLAHLPGWVLTVAGFLAVVLLVLAVGALAPGIAGRWFIGRFDEVMRRLPLVRAIYGSARELTDAVFVKRSSLRKTVVAEYPRRGMLAVGFLTSDERYELADGRKAVFVFFPTTPNPTSGWLALIPEDEITETGMSIDEGLKLVVSGGVVRPASLRLGKG
jgi:uncharacterized membrane protein